MYVEGNLRTRSWSDNNGNQRYMTEIVAKDMQLIDQNSGVAVDQKQASVASNHQNNSWDDDYGSIPFAENDLKSSGSTSKNSFDWDDSFDPPF